MVILAPTYDDLMAISYIKVARVLMPSFVKVLCDLFGPERVKIAPVKGFERVQMKIEEVKKLKQAPPYASHVCDYLRATVLCQNMQEMIPTIKSLCNKHQVVRIRRRILPSDQGNKAVLLKVVVEDPDIEPRQYEWSGWWKKGKVRMIAEVYSSFL